MTMGRDQVFIGWDVGAYHLPPRPGSEVQV